MKMWVIVLSMLSLCLFSITASAQIVLSPSVSGTAFSWYWTYNWSSGPTGTHVSNGSDVFSNYIQVGGQAVYSFQHYTYRSQTKSFWNGVLEFPLTGFPTNDMTESNWTARLNGLSITYVLGEVGQTFYVNLFDMWDGAEDNTLSIADWDAAHGFINGIISTIPSPGDTYDNIDVTEAVRRDLFGEGQLGDSTGFILKSSIIDTEFIRWARFNKILPELVINVTPAPRLPVTSFFGLGILVLILSGFICIGTIRRR